MQTRISVLVVLLVLGLPCFAHGLLLDAESDGSGITGTAYYTNGDRASHQSVVLVDLADTSGRSLSTQTDADGRFSFSVTPSRKYRVSVYGDEGHQVDVELTAMPSAKPKLVEVESEGASEWVPPAWAVLGAGLLLSLIPASLFARRNRSPPAR